MVINSMTIHSATNIRTEKAKLDLGGWAISLYVEQEQGGDFTINIFTENEALCDKLGVPDNEKQVG